MTTGITIPQLPDGATLDDTDLLEIVRTAADGTQSSMRVSASYFLAWLDGKDLSDAVATAPGSETAQTLASVAGTANGAAAAATAAGKAAAGAQTTANNAIPSTAVGKAGGVAGLDASGNVTAPVTGDASAATVVPTGSPAGTSGTKLSDLAKTANGAVQSSQVGALNGVPGYDNYYNVQGRSFRAIGDTSYGIQPLTGGNVVLLNPGTGGQIRSSTDNSYNLGAGSYRFANVFAGTSAINTSDATEKTLASATSPFTLAQIKAALRPLQTRLYQWNDMILKKGADKARYHVGYLAQDVYALLMAANIDPTMTAMWCNDALTQEVLVTPGKEAVTTTDPKTGAVTIVTPAVDPVYETQPVLNADGTQKYRQGLRMEMVHAVLIDDSRDRIATLEAGYAALVARVTALEAKNS